MLLMSLLTYLREVRIELSKVTWPTQAQTRRLTTIVIGASLVVALYVGSLDFLFANLLGLLFK